MEASKKKLYVDRCIRRDTVTGDMIGSIQCVREAVCHILRLVVVHCKVGD